MISYVLLSNNFSRQLKRLRQAGGKARTVADHAEAIVQQWVSGEVKNTRQLTRNTRYGEARLKNCFKYDLVEAYRLLAVMDDESLIFVFVGSHDECDQWLYHNKGWEPGLEKKGMKLLRIQAATSTTAADEGDPPEDRAVEDDQWEEIEERDLRIVFSGICRARAGRRQREVVGRAGK